MENTKEAVKAKITGEIQGILKNEFNNTTLIFEKQAIIKIAQGYGFDKLAVELGNTYHQHGISKV